MRPLPSWQELAQHKLSFRNLEVPLAEQEEGSGGFGLRPEVWSKRRIRRRLWSRGVEILEIWSGVEFKERHRQ